jgi:hypothetical protein
MKKASGKATANIKLTFGKRREGKHQKSFGPKHKGIKKYKGQGR